MQWFLASSNAPRLISRRHRGRCPAFILTTCEGCCKGDVSSISCNESTPHTSSISPTEICLLVAMVLTGVSQIVRASNLYCFIARLFSTCSRLRAIGDRWLNLTDVEKIASNYKTTE